MPRAWDLYVIKTVNRKTIRKNIRQFHKQKHSMKERKGISTKRRAKAIYGGGVKEKKEEVESKSENDIASPRSTKNEKAPRRKYNQSREN